MRALLLGLALALGLAASPVFAQDGPEASERSRELAREYIEIIDLERFVLQLYEGTLEQADTWAELLGTEQGPGDPKPSSAAARMPTFVPEGQMEQLRPYLDMIEDLLVEAHARAFSEAELEAMLALYRTETGRAIAARQDDLVLAIITVAMERADQFQELINQDLAALEGDEGEDLEGFDDYDAYDEEWVDPTPPLIRQMAPGL